MLYSAIMGLAEAPQTAQERELSAAFERMRSTFDSLPDEEGYGQRSVISSERSKRLILADGTRIYMVQKKGSLHERSAREASIFVNATYPGVGDDGLPRERVTTFSLSPRGLTDLYISPVSVRIEIDGASIATPSTPIRLRTDSVRFNDATKNALKGVAPAMVDWAIRVVTDRRYSDPPYRLSV